MLANLLANSLDAIGQDGRIVLRASASIDPIDGTRRVRITVADSGRGAWHSLWQSPKMSSILLLQPKERPGSTGLHLCVCKQLVEKNHGSINLILFFKTEGQWQRTTFSILLPRYAGTSLLR